METIFGILLGLAVPFLLIGGIIYLIMRGRSANPLKVSYRTILRMYLYIVILVSIGLSGGGISALFKVGFAEMFGPEFSYGSVYEEHQWEQEDDYRRQLDARNPDYPKSETDFNSRTLQEKIEFTKKSTLINGVTISIVGLLLLTIHIFSRRWVETVDERSDGHRRLYLVVGLVIFSIVTVVTLATGLPEALRYALLEVTPGEESPGGALSVAIVALPVWLYYLVVTLRTVRSN
jgi:hypothetical protein